MREALAELHERVGFTERRLRIGASKRAVYRKRGQFAALGHRAKAHWLLVGDAVRVMSRIKSLMRSRGVQVSGTAVYCATGHSEWITRLPQAARPAMELLYRGKTDQESRSLRVASQLDWSLLAIERQGLKLRELDIDNQEIRR